MWKCIEKRYWRRKVQEEEEKRKKDGGDKGKKDGEDDQQKKDDGDRWKKGDGDKGKKDDGDMGQKHKKEDKDEDKKRKDRKREEKDDDEIAGEELEEQLWMEADRERRRLEMQSVLEDTLDYVEDQNVEDNNDKEDNDEDQLENKKAFDRYRGNDDNFNVEGDYDTAANNNGDEEDDNDDDDQERDDNDDTSATSEEKVGSDDRPGEWDARKKEEKICFNFEVGMEMVCKCLAFTHGHDIEELLRMDRMIKAFCKKKEWLNLRA